MRIILLGPPGSGKGTQANLICKKFNIVTLSTGDMLRSIVASNSELGQKVAKIMQEGRLVSDDIIENIIEARMKENDCKNGFILDGAVRTIKQAEMIERVFDHLNLELDKVIELRIDSKHLLSRINNRIKESDEKRVDDDPLILEKRLEVYQKETVPLIDFYEKKGLLSVVNASEPIEKVNMNINRILEQKIYIKGCV